MKKNASYIVLYMAAVLLLAMVVSGNQPVADQGVICNPSLLGLCLPALTSPAPLPPTFGCCSGLRLQKPCLCRHLRDPNFRRYVDSPNARRISAACGVTYPKC